MEKRLVEEYITDLWTTQVQVIGLLRSVQESPDWSPSSDRWSFRFIAAHLATTEKECFLDRVKRLKEELRPEFQYYDNTDYDFSQQGLLTSVENWKATRWEIIEFVRGMTYEEREKEGVHETIGEMGLIDLFKLMIAHDQEHRQELQENLHLYQLESEQI